MIPDLSPRFRRFADVDSEYNFLPTVSSWYNTPQLLYSPKNEFDERISYSNNETNIELAKIYKRIEEIRSAKESFITTIKENPGKTNWDLELYGEERGIFRIQPKLLTIKIR
jgi:hypothetical protein